MLANVIEISEKKRKLPTLVHCQQLSRVRKSFDVDVCMMTYEIMNLVSSYGIPN